MAYPPVVPPSTRTDATVMATNHPADHNLTSLALTEILNHITAMEQALYPIGVIVEWGADLAPGNHEFCRGQAVSRASYPEVFSLIGSKFGGGDGVNTFNMPDFRGRLPIGFNIGGTYMSAGLGERFGSPDAVLVYHDHDVTHQHGVNIWTSYTDVNHYHVNPSGGRGFIVDGGGNNGSAGIALGAPNGYAFQTAVGLAEPNDGRMNHRHAVNGTTDPGAMRTAANGQSGSNANLPPVLSVNFIMRMH